MDYLVKEMLVHYHEERPHQSKENDPLVRAATANSVGDVPDVPLSQIECRQRLGGLLKHYYRKAA
jgi:putative transposase